MTLETHNEEELIQLYKDIESNSYIYLDILYKYREDIFNVDKSFNYNNLLKKILEASIKKHDSDLNEWVCDQDKMNLQTELLKLCLDKDVNINNSEYIRLEIILSNYHWLPELEVNPLSQEKILSSISSMRNKIDSNGNHTAIDKEYIQQKAGLIELFFKDGILDIEGMH